MIILTLFRLFIDYIVVGILVSIVLFFTQEKTAKEFWNTVITWPLVIFNILTKKI